jgi:hypothetical protein
LVKLFEETGGPACEDGESLACGKVAEGTGEPRLSNACGAREEDVASGRNPAWVGEFQEDLFLETARVPVVNVLEAGVVVAEACVFEESSEATVIAIGFFVLDEKSDEFLVGEFGVGGVFETGVKPLGEAEEFELIECGHGLFEHHG